MKQILLYTVCIAMMSYHSTIWAQSSTSSNLPNPVAITRTMPAGSYVIAMDNTWQTNENTNASLRKFNLKAYGLIVHLLNNNVKVKRVMRTTKLKDEPDFKTLTTKVKPTADLAEVQREFKAGPFVIFAYDLPSNIDDIIDTYNNNAGGMSGITNASNRVKVYVTKTSATVQAQHDLAGFKPKACILDDGGNAAIHEKYMVLAGVPTVNYVISSSATQLDVNCYTFASEPHNDNPVPEVVTAIKNFVNMGGNLLAQCAAVETYENANRLQTTGGIVVSNIAPTSAVAYPNASLPYSQFEGVFNINKGGSCKNWVLHGGSSWQNNGHIHATGTNVKKEKDGSLTLTTAIGASAAKITDNTQEGGMVFYLGNHEFSSITEYEDINGIRMYMNAFLTPCRKQGLMSYHFNLQYDKMKVKAKNNANKGYPVTFKLYADKGNTKGIVDASDVLIGTITILSATHEAEISISPAYLTNTPYVMTIAPNPATYCDNKKETVQPAPLNFTPLAASLPYFEGKRQGQVVVLDWKLPADTDIKGFVIQQRTGEAEWTARGFVPNDNRDNKTGLWHYSFKDKSPLPGKAEYRLQLQNKDGSNKYSPVIWIGEEKGAGRSFILYPNPSAGKITLQFMGAEARDILIRDAFGREVSLIKGVSRTSQVIEGLKPGIYLVTIIDHINGAALTEKLIVK